MARLAVVMVRPVPAWRSQDLADAEGFIQVDGERRTGLVRDLLTVIDSLRWLAGALARNGLSLRAGQIVPTGTLVTPVPISLPTRVVSMGDYRVRNASDVNDALIIRHSSLQTGQE